jgi:hypothetical protein
VGPRGLTVLSIAGIAGLLFGVHGWSQRDTGLVAPLVTSPPASPAPAAANAPASAAVGSPSPAATSSATGSGSASPSAAGPQLSAMPYASFAYLVWPGPVSATAKTALHGWTITVTRQPGGITVKAVLSGQLMTSLSHFYPGGAKVYVLDSELGDDVGTDEGMAVTNAQGQVLG